MNELSSESSDDEDETTNAFEIMKSSSQSTQIKRKKGRKPESSIHDNFVYNKETNKSICKYCDNEIVGGKNNEFDITYSIIS